MIHRFKVQSHLRVRILIALAVIATFCSGQNVNNPFEIKNRIDSESSTSSIVVEYETGDELSDTTRLYTSPAVPTIIKATPEEVKEDEEVLALVSGQNPFEVNHVPLRKSIVRRSEAISSNSNKSGQKDGSSNSKAFIFWVVITALIFLVLSFASSPKMMGNVTKSILNENILKLEHRSKHALSLGYILLYIVYFINAGVFILLMWNYFGEGVISFANYMRCIGLVIGIYLIRHIGMALFGTIFPLQKEADLYSFAIQVFNSFIGVVLIPLNLMLAFGPESMLQFVVYFSLSLLAILLIIRSIRGLVISINHIFSHLLLFFIYLCSLEIAPVLILMRFLQNY